MSSTKFTKGEWNIYISPVNLNRGYVSVESGDRRIFGEQMYNSTQTEDIANAHLIAAAPDMYAMLESLLSLEGIIKTDNINRLLAKARGETK